MIDILIIQAMTDAAIIHALLGCEEFSGAMLPVVGTTVVVSPADTNINIT
jgi:hypothetical protein